MTLMQLLILYANLQEQLYDELILQAGMHGIDVEGAAKEQSGNVTQQTQSLGKDKPLFPDPKQFDHLSDEEKKQKTKELMAMHQKVVKDWL